MLQPASFTVVALLIGGAIVWAVAGGSDSPSATKRVTSPLETRAVQIERKAAADPRNKTLDATAMKTWIRAGAEKLEAIDPRTEPVPDAVVNDYEAGLRAWMAYLKQAGQAATPRLAETAAGTYFELVEIGSTDPRRAAARAAGAASAQGIVCRGQRTLYALSNLATYRYFAGEYAAGDKAARGAIADASRNELGVKSVIVQLNEFKARGEKFVARVKRGLRILEETGEDELDTLIKGYGAPAGLNGYEPGAGPS
jgi:hypothetical protein